MQVIKYIENTDVTFLVVYNLPYGKYTCRILEHDCELIGKSKDKKEKEEIEITLEIWDLAGNLKYQDCWDIAQKNLIGAILLFDSSKISNDKDLFDYYSQFVQSAPKASNTPKNQHNSETGSSSYIESPTKQCLLIDVNNNLMSDDILKQKSLQELSCLNIGSKWMKSTTSDHSEQSTIDAAKLKQLFAWIGELFGYHPDAEFGVF